MTREEFEQLAQDVIQIYGVDSWLDNLDSDPDDEPWFACPECGEPILYSDWHQDLWVWENEDGDKFLVCPICEENIDLN